MSRRYLEIFAALFLLTGLASWAWYCIPSDHRVFSQQQFAESQTLFSASSSVPPVSELSRFTLENNSLRVNPGESLVFQRSQLGDMLHGRCQTVSPNGALAQFIAHHGDQQIVLGQWQSNPALHAIDTEPFYFLINLRELSPDVDRISLAVAANSPGAVDWRQLAGASAQDRGVPPLLPFPFIFFCGYAPPSWENRGLYLHAPAQFILNVPQGRYSLKFGFGYNPLVFARPDNYTDGAGFRVSLITAEGGSDLLNQQLQPMADTSHRQTQIAELMFATTSPASLSFEVDAGPRGGLSFDWLVWQDFQLFQP